MWRSSETFPEHLHIYNHHQSSTAHWAREREHTSVGTVWPPLYHFCMSMSTMSYNMSYNILQCQQKLKTSTVPYSIMAFHCMTWHHKALQAVLLDIVDIVSVVFVWSLKDPSPRALWMLWNSKLRKAHRNLLSETLQGLLVVLHSALPVSSLFLFGSGAGIKNCTVWCLKILDDIYMWSTLGWVSWGIRPRSFRDWGWPWRCSPMHPPQTFGVGIFAMLTYKANARETRKSFKTTGLLFNRVTIRWLYLSIRTFLIKMEKIQNTPQSIQKVSKTFKNFQTHFEKCQNKLQHPRKIRADTGR